MFDYNPSQNKYLYEEKEKNLLELRAGFGKSRKNSSELTMLTRANEKFFEI
jgi:hypothetical protein